MTIDEAPPEHPDKQIGDMGKTCNVDTVETRMYVPGTSKGWLFATLKVKRGQHVVNSESDMSSDTHPERHVDVAEGDDGAGDSSEEDDTHSHKALQDDALLLPISEGLRQELTLVSDAIRAILGNRQPDAMRALPVCIRKYFRRRTQRRSTAQLKQPAARHNRFKPETFVRTDDAKWMPHNAELVRFAFQALSEDASKYVVFCPHRLEDYEISAKLMNSLLGKEAAARNRSSGLVEKTERQGASAASELLARLVGVSNDIKLENPSDFEIPSAGGGADPCTFLTVGAQERCKFLHGQTKGSGIEMSNAGYKSMLPRVLEEAKVRYAHVLCDKARGASCSQSSGDECMDDGDSE